MVRNCILAIIAFICIFVLSSAASEAREPGWQRDLVKQMLNSTAIGRKFAQRNTIYNSDLCSWSEFSCDLNMHVTRFNIWMGYFAYTIPETIGQLTSLEYLAIDGYNENRITTIPSVIGDLANLRYLMLGRYLAGTIPSTLEGLTNLEEIDLQDSSLTGTIPIGLGLNQPKLRRINLRGNRLTGTIPDELVKLAFDDVVRDYMSYSLIDLSHNQLTGSVPAVIYQSSVQWLSLYNNSLTIFDENIPMPQKLGFCDLSCNPFVCPIPQWALDSCKATCTNIAPITRIEGLSGTTVAIIIASACLFAIVVVALALYFSRRRVPRPVP